jgi:hypothetical protein
MWSRAGDADVEDDEGEEEDDLARRARLKAMLREEQEEEELEKMGDEACAPTLRNDVCLFLAP